MTNNNIFTNRTLLNIINVHFTLIYNIVNVWTFFVFLLYLQNEVSQKGGIFYLKILSGTPPPHHRFEENSFQFFKCPQYLKSMNGSTRVCLTVMDIYTLKYMFHVSVHRHAEYYCMFCRSVLPLSEGSQQMLSVSRIYSPQKVEDWMNSTCV